MEEQNPNEVANFLNGLEAPSVLIAEDSKSAEYARLIAAAPDLLAVLKEMVVEYCDYTIINNLGDPETQHNIKLARAAIAKAEGAHVAALEAKERT